VDHRSHGEAKHRDHCCLPPLAQRARQDKPNRIAGPGVRFSARAEIMNKATVCGAGIVRSFNLRSFQDLHSQCRMESTRRVTYRIVTPAHWRTGRDEGRLLANAVDAPGMARPRHPTSRLFARACARISALRIHAFAGMTGLCVHPCGFLIRLAGLDSIGQSDPKNTRRRSNKICSNLR
jgi:hypothetical protein